MRRLRCHGPHAGRLARARCCRAPLNPNRLETSQPALPSSRRCRLDLQPMPPEVVSLLERLASPPRLVAHLTLVHDVACTLIDRVDEAWPDLAYDREAVRFGAATHDIGKLAHPEELTQPGHMPEAAGESLLRSQGYPDELSRFARTHGEWAGESAPQLEDALVALTDNWWRGSRNESLEGLMCQLISQQVGADQWQVFLALDDIATGITADADGRLAWQNQHAT
jgi:hypothetical protein